MVRDLPADVVAVGNPRVIRTLRTHGADSTLTSCSSTVAWRPARAAAQAMILAGEVELEGAGRTLKPGNLAYVDAQRLAAIGHAGQPSGDKLEVPWRPSPSTR